MKPSTRWIAAVVGIAAVIALFLIFRPGGSSPGPAGTPSAVASTSPSPSRANDAPSPSEQPTSTSTPTTSDVAEIDLTVRNEDVQGPSGFDVKQGQDVRIVVDADVSDEVHVHGYDLHGDVAPGEPAVIEFTANAPGVFEVELESVGKLLFELKVSP